VIAPPEAWRRNQYVTVAMVFVVFTGFAFVIPFLPLYVRELGVAKADVALWAGVLIGIAQLLAGLLAPVWGRLADQFGHKHIAIKALVAYVVLLVLSSLVTSVWQLLVLRIGVGLFGGIGPLGLAMATTLAPRDETGRAVGMVQAAQILSAAIGPLAGGWLADSVGIRRTFLATDGLCAIALLLVMRYYVEAPRPPAAARSGPGFADVLRISSVPALLVVLFLVNFIGRSFTPILPGHLHELGVDVSRLAFATGMLISVYSVAAALSAALLGRASRRMSPRLLLVATLVCGAAVVLPMARVPSFGWVLVLATLLGLASGGSLTLCYTIGGLMVPPEIKTTAFGFFSGAALFGGAVSPSVAGFLARSELRGIYYLDAALYVLLALALLPSLRKAVESKG
jgi:MFS family permease